jgi:hypothetical protein
MLWRRSARFGAAALAILYGIFSPVPLAPLLYGAALPQEKCRCRTAQ